MQPIPVVSVCLITYNHAKFIREAIESVLMQQTSFDFEVILADDFSSDGTREIVKEYAQKDSRIKPILRDKNVGPGKNFLEMLAAGKGKYIAYLEGDDYWTDPLRLQKQVDFLEHNPDYNMTVGRHQILNEKSGKFKNNRELFNINKPLSLKNYIAFNFGHTSTFLFKNNFDFPEWYATVFAGDQAFFITNTKNKKVKYFDDFFSVYRVNEGGITSSVKAQQSVKNTEKFLDKIDDYTNKKYHLLINNRKRLNKFYYYFESTPSKLLKNVIRIPILFFRWWGINVLVKFIKE
jgi:glycosyltransferase involved in cell wall biosynthesis